MLFNSIEFAVFFLVVFMGYWTLSVKSWRIQNLFLLGASYCFYAAWDWRFLGLIFASSLVDFTLGNLIFKTKSRLRRRLLLFFSIIFNIGLLGFFKYFNFFIDSFCSLSLLIGISPNINSLDIILPVGISFYTFQTLSYTLDIYRKKLEPTTNAIGFFTFVSFFPQLVAGPIERAKSLLPQFLKARQFGYKHAKEGMQLILWGLFKKIVVADNCAIHVNEIFENYSTLDGSVLLLGGVLFAFQIYCDFSGYSDIAVGVAGLLGFSLIRNFEYPYFSRDIAEFWRRWHISLSTWFRDYIFIPLGGSRVSKGLVARNILLTFTISGLWHGANWTFVFWGILNGLYYFPLIFRKKRRTYTDIVAFERVLPSAIELLLMLRTFLLIVIAWIFFRAQNIGEATSYLLRVFSESLFKAPSGYNQILALISFFILMEWIQRKKKSPLELENWPKTLKGLAYGAITLLIVFFQVNATDIDFIYFQF
ncbi:hypothetical protein N9092_03700 [Akkermansiaceae bacterium]|nr:hypothetical protein [Akkermansiaceae bacterium]